MDSKIVSGITLQSFVMADSTFVLEIKDVKAMQSGKQIVSDNISLNLGAASWTILVVQRENTWFFADLPELRGKTQKVLFVSCEGHSVPTHNYFGSSLDSQIILCCHNSILAQHVKDNKITLNFRLMISSERGLRLDIFDPQVYQKSLVNRITSMFGDSTFADFTFIVSGQEFKVHMNILAAASPVMRRMFTGDLEEARTKTCTIDAIAAETFYQLLRYIYLSEVPKDFEAVAMALYEAAHYYEIEELKKVCARKINKDLSLANALEVFEWVQPYDDFKHLKLYSWAIIKCDILKIDVELEKEPLTMKQVYAVIKRTENDKKFWKELEKEEEAGEKSEIDP